MKKRSILAVFCTVVLGMAVIILLRPVGITALNPSHNGCATCHTLHGAPGQTLTNNLSVEVLCLSCHGPAGISTKKAEVHTNRSGSSYPAFRMTCMDCHNPHDNMGDVYGGMNIKQVGRKLDSSGYAMIGTPYSGIRSVVFRSRGESVWDLYPFADDDRDNNGVYNCVCEVCHTQTRYHRNDSSGRHNHHTGKTCVNCHPHNNYFL